MAETTGSAEQGSIRLEPKAEGGFEPGGFWWRVLAAIVDGIDNIISSCI